MDTKNTGRDPERNLLTAAVALAHLGNKNSNEEESAEKAEQHSDDFEDDNAKIFPQRLMEILSEESNNESITWLPHGKGFIIRNRRKFAAEVLPRYFKKTKYTSFTRKLNRWNFTRVTKGPEIGAYYHKYFQKGQEALCTQMYCKNERAKFANATVTGAQTPSHASTSLPAPRLPLEAGAIASPIAQTQNLPLLQARMLRARVQAQAQAQAQVQAQAQAQAQARLQAQMQAQAQKLPAVLLSQNAKMMLAASQAPKVNMYSGASNPTHAAVINAAIRALHRSNTLANNGSAGAATASAGAPSHATRPVSSAKAPRFGSYRASAA